MIGLLNSDARMIPLVDGTVQCVITSPPYWGLRDYGVDGQIGLERTPEEYISNIVAVMRECWRVMRDDGTLWLNLGDSYASGEIGRHDSVQANNGNGWTGTRKMKVRQQSKLNAGLKPKDLAGIPWRVAFALQADGWYLRSDIIWHKPNPMPESVTDRPTKSHEYIFLLTKSERYYYDAEAIKEPLACPNETRRPLGSKGAWQIDGREQRENGGGSPYDGYPSARNKRSVWTIATQPYSGAHFAIFPPALVEPMILAGSHPGDLILDPFAGTATVGRVCIKHGRSFVGLDLNMTYIDLAEHRTSRVQTAIQFAGVA